MSSSVDQIKAKLDIVSVVGGYIKLEKTGGNFKARCPFHNEKTPSFFVSVDRGNYYCFGCGAKGDIFTFVEEFEGLDFSGALKVLAERAGVQLENFRPEEKSDKDTLFSLMEQATFYFEKNLSEHPEARAYLQSRGVTDETIKRFRLGYALADWRGLHDFLISKGATPEDMLRAGLVKRKDGTTGFYDTFRSRIMFPIGDSSARIVAFSGRIFPEPPKDESGAPVAPKYLNSPETAIFHKSEVLYGLDKAKKEIHVHDYSILVEGQMDLVMLHQAGFMHTVASSGTALTEAHLVRLQRLSNRIIMALDGDSAGYKAITRGTEIALSLGMEVKVAAMPKGKDPADMALSDKAGLIDTVKNAKHFISFVLDTLVAETPDARLLARKTVSELLPFVARINSSSEQGHFVKEINKQTGIKEDALWEDLRKVQSVKIKNQNEIHNEKKPISDRSDVILEKLIGILFWQKEKTTPGISVTELEKNINESIGEDRFSAVIQSTLSRKDSLIFEAESYYNGVTNLSSDVSELVSNLTEEKLKKEFAETMILLHKSESSGDPNVSADLLAKCQEISKKLNELKSRNMNNSK
jgi:DNA primase